MTYINLIKIVRNVRERPSMYVEHGELNPNYYELLSCLLDGYMICMSAILGTSVLGAFHNFIEKKYKKSFSICANSYIYTYISKRNQELAVKNLLDNLEEFAAVNSQKEEQKYK